MPRQARLTESSYAAWERLLTRRGVTFTTLIEALGELLDQGVDWVPEEAIQRARQIDRQRHSRRER
jgi:hypothetical protein